MQQNPVNAGLNAESEKRKTMTEPNDPQQNRPNLYEVSGGGVRVSYSTTSINGLPRFSYHDCGVDREFTGNQINTRTTELALEVTVTLEPKPDLETVTVTLLVPEINMGSESEGEFATVVIQTTNHTSIGGPRLIHGPLQTYRSIDMHGTAKAVIS